MKFLSKIFIAMVVSALSVGTTAAYTLNVRNGMLPNDVTVANLNRVTPDANGYKRGWTQDGWTVDRFGDRGYILVSPTYTLQDVPCANSLTLPAIEISEGDYLTWDVRSAMPDLNEAYAVYIREEGQDESLAEMLVAEDAVPGKWISRVFNLGNYVGKNVIIEFRVVSTNKYLLCLDKVKVGKLTGYSFMVDRISPVLFDAKDVADSGIRATFEVTNTGMPIENGVFDCICKGEKIPSINIEKRWETGEVRTLEFDLPAVTDTHKTYTITFNADDTEELYLYEGEYFCTTYKPNLMVDKGTGTWCVNCPESSLVVDQLRGRFGDNLIMLETHNEDVMANEEYFAELEYRAIPYWMLNRISATRFSKPTMFDEYIFRPCRWSVALTEVVNVNNEKLSVSALVKTADDVDNSTDRYRAGFVVTSNFYEPDDHKFSQRNNSSIPGAEQFYYLPTQIPAQLMHYHDVTLTVESAFCGIEHSLPASFNADRYASVNFDIERPELLDNLDDARVVVFVMDTETGEIMNSTAGCPGDDFAFSSIQDIADLSSNITYPQGIWNLQGIRVADSSQNLPTGIYIYKGKKIRVK